MPLNSLWFGGFEDINNMSFIWKEKSSIHVQLIYPVALNEGLRFAIREGGRTVGAGQITEIVD